MKLRKTLAYLFVAFLFVISFGGMVALIAWFDYTLSSGPVDSFRSCLLFIVPGLAGVYWFSFFDFLFDIFPLLRHWKKDPSNTDVCSRLGGCSLLSPWMCCRSSGSMSTPFICPAGLAPLSRWLQQVRFLHRTPTGRRVHTGLCL